MRVYLPVGWDQLEALTSGPIDVATGHAVTDEVRRELPGCDDEELEYAVSGAAANEAVALVTPERPRRVVLAVDASAQPTGNLSEVRLDSAVALADVAAVLVDAEDASSELGEQDLGWYAVQEIGPLLRR